MAGGAGPAAPRADFFVSPAGNDRWSGTLPTPNKAGTDGPFATPARARNAVRRLKGLGPARDLTVLLRGGTYRLGETVVFGLEDTAPDEHTITYAAYPGEAPVLCGSVPVLGWQRLEQAPPELPAAAHGKVWVADVSWVRERKAKLPPSVTVADQMDAGWRFLTLYDGDRRLPRARAAGFQPERAEGIAKDGQALRFAGAPLREWTDLREGELSIIPVYYWIHNILPLESVDESAGVARTAVRGTYLLGRNGMADRPTAWAENVLAALDEPGEWALNTQQARLTYWPAGGSPGENVSVPLLTELVRVEGKTDYAGPTDTPVRGLVFRGITFTGGDRFPWHGGTGWGLQHDWERFDSPTALLRFRGAERCVVEECRFTTSGGTGVRFDLHCRENRVVGSEFQHLGGVAILLAGYGPGTKDVNRENVVENDLIHHTGEGYWGSPAVFAWQSGGNRIARNLIHHTPYTAIVVSGRIGWHPEGKAECARTVRWSETGVPQKAPVPRMGWYDREKFLHARRNVVERNEIHHAMQVMGDGNAIYISGAGGGNRVRENYVHDCYGEYMNAAIRCDDDQHETLLEANVITRTGGFGEGINSKGRNDIVNNIIVDLLPDARHRGYLAFPYDPVKDSLVQRNVIATRWPEQRVCFEGRAMRQGQEDPRLRHTRADGNLYWCGKNAAWGARHLEAQRPHGIEANSRAADPLFVDPAGGDFRFRPGSPAPAMGIRAPFAPGEAGLQEPYRRRFLGTPIRTRILADDGVLETPVRLAMATDGKGAAIHYTMDGGEPTQQSPRYAGPFLVRRPGTVRARAFAPGYSDTAGATVRFTPPALPVVADCEGVPAGARLPGWEAMDEAGAYTARVTGAQAAGGQRCLEFRDGPGQERAFNPHVFLKLPSQKGLLRGSFDVRLDAASVLIYEWRDYKSAPPFTSGPRISFGPGGVVQAGGREVGRVPVGQWVRVAVACEPGRPWSLRVTAPGLERPLEADGVAGGEGFAQMTWVGFIAAGKEDATFYVDNIRLER